MSSALRHFRAKEKRIILAEERRCSRRRAVLLYTWLRCISSYTRGGSCEEGKRDKSPIVHVQCCFMRQIAVMYRCTRHFRVEKKRVMLKKEKRSCLRRAVLLYT